MPLPSLKKFIKKKESQSKEYFLALEIEDEIKAAIWEETEKITIKGFVKAKTVKRAVEKLKEKVDIFPSKVIFGLPTHLIEKDKIKKEYLNKLKEITKEFSLAPLGFVVIPEAIAHFLEVQEETPQTTILIKITKEKLTFSLFRGGVNRKTKRVDRTENIYSDFEDGLSKFSQEEVLPSKIILYDNEESLEEIKEDLLSYPWQKNDKFLHVPKIKILPWDFSIKAVVEAGVSELKKKDVDLTVEHFPSKVSKSSPDIEGSEDKEKELTDASAMGFIEEKDIAQKEEIKTAPLSSKIPKFTNLFQNFKIPNLDKFNWDFLKNKGLLVFFVLLFVFGGIFTSSLYFYPKANLKLIADPEIFNKSVEITLNTAIASPDIEKKEIPGKVYSAKAEGIKTKETSSKKTIGEKAKGEVTIYNKTTSLKTFKKGTILIGPNKLKFTLDENVTVASVSDVITGNPGTEKVKLTAEKIGPSGNLKAGSDFTINDFPLTSYAARNEKALEGGIKREIAVVGKEDQESLLKDLTEELKEKIKDNLESQLSTEEKFLEESLIDNVIQKVFDKEEQEEADNVSLKLELEFSKTAYRKEDINKFLESYIKEFTPSDFTFDPKNTSFKVINSKIKEDGSVVFKAEYRAYFLPKIDLANIKKKIIGKTLEELEKEIKSLKNQNIIGYELSFSRKFPFLGNKLPLWDNGIEIEIVNF